ncbi:MAG: bifunctional phosphoglucose/phosphomannose isomerase [Anaerolineales bacterium]
MNLDDLSTLTQIDSHNMLAEIDGLPDQLETAWQTGQTFPLPELTGIRQVLIAGMGGSAIGADLLAAYAAPLCRVPIFIQRNYGLPAWAHGEHTLVIASSHSGNTEETLEAFHEAGQRGCLRIAISTGGTLAEAARAQNVPLWQFPHKGQPRAAVGFSFGLLLAVFSRLNLLPNPENDLRTALSALRAQQTHLRADVPTVNNPAKRMAGQLYGRWVAVFSSDVLEPVARRWKGQISELAKTWAQFEALPEADHNTLAGVHYPPEGLMHTFTLFLRAPSYHPRNRLRANLTKKIFMLEALNTDFYDAPGETRLAHLWTALHFGDYMAYYLAIAYGVDPTPVEAIEMLKVELKKA